MSGLKLVEVTIGQEVAVHVNRTSSTATFCRTGYIHLYTMYQMYPNLELPAWQLIDHREKNGMSSAMFEEERIGFQSSFLVR